MCAVAVAVALAVALTAACGGENHHLSLVSASKCLVRVDGATTDLGTPLHQAMSGGALRVVFPTNEVEVGFGKDGDEAGDVREDIRAGLSGTVAARTNPADELVTVSQNVVLVWKAPPGEQERAAVKRCLE